MSIGRKSPEEKEADAAAMRARYAEKERAARSARMKAFYAKDDDARNGTDLLPPPLKQVEPVEDIPPVHETSTPLLLAARTSAPISEKMKDHLQRASAIGVQANKERRALGLGIKEGKVYKSSSELIRKFLEDGRKGAVNERGQTRLIQMIEKMHEIAVSKSPRAVQAFEALMARAYGKPKPSEEALDALAKGGVQIVYVAPPELESHEQKQLAPKPDFIDAEIIDD